MDEHEKRREAKMVHRYEFHRKWNTDDFAGKYHLFHINKNQKHPLPGSVIRHEQEYSIQKEREKKMVADSMEAAQKARAFDTKVKQQLAEIQTRVQVDTIVGEPMKKAEEILREKVARNDPNPPNQKSNSRSEIKRFFKNIEMGRHMYVGFAVTTGYKSINYQDPATGNTALHVAVRKGYPDCVEELLKFHIDPDTRNRLNNAAAHDAWLHWRVHKHRHEEERRLEEEKTCQILSKIFSYGGFVDTQDTKGQTPLHIACRLGPVQAVVTILGFKANNHIKTYDGLTPMDIAVQYGHEEIQRLLQSWDVIKKTMKHSDFNVLWRRFTKEHEAVISNEKDAQTTLFGVEMGQKIKTLERRAITSLQIDDPLMKIAHEDAKHQQRLPKPWEPMWSAFAERKLKEEKEKEEEELNAQIDAFGYEMDGDGEDDTGTQTDTDTGLEGGGGGGGAGTLEDGGIISGVEAVPSLTQSSEFSLNVPVLGSALDQGNVQSPSPLMGFKTSAEIGINSGSLIFSPGESVTSRVRLAVPIDEVVKASLTSSLTRSDGSGAAANTTAAVVAAAAATARGLLPSCSRPVSPNQLQLQLPGMAIMRRSSVHTPDKSARKFVEVITSQMTSTASGATGTGESDGDETARSGGTSYRSLTSRSRELKPLKLPKRRQYPQRPIPEPRPRMLKDFSSDLPLYSTTAAVDIDPLHLNARELRRIGDAFTQKMAVGEISLEERPHEHKRSSATNPSLKASTTSVGAGESKSNVESAAKSALKANIVRSGPVTPTGVYDQKIAEANLKALNDAFGGDKANAVFSMKTGTGVTKAATSTSLASSAEKSAGIAVDTSGAPRPQLMRQHTQKQLKHIEEKLKEDPMNGIQHTQIPTVRERRMRAAHTVARDAKFERFTTRQAAASALLLPLRAVDAPMEGTEEETNIMRMITSQGPDFDLAENSLKTQAERARKEQLARKNIVEPPVSPRIDHLGGYCEPVNRFDEKLARDNLFGRLVDYEAVQKRDLETMRTVAAATGDVEEAKGQTKKNKIPMIGSKRAQFIGTDMLPPNHVVTLIEQLIMDREKAEAEALAAMNINKDDIEGALMTEDDAAAPANATLTITRNAAEQKAEMMKKRKAFLAKPHVVYGKDRLTSTHMLKGELDAPWQHTPGNYKTIPGDRTA